MRSTAPRWISRWRCCNLARAVVAGEGGPLIGELRAFRRRVAADAKDTVNPFRICGKARLLAKLVPAERVDIVHAQSAGAAWSALAAIRRMSVFF